LHTHKRCGFIKIVKDISKIIATFLKPQRGSHKIAQGNALGKRDRAELNPERVI
jgi:hypothetical protein